LMWVGGPYAKLAMRATKAQMLHNSTGMASRLNPSASLTTLATVAIDTGLCKETLPGT